MQSLLIECTVRPALIAASAGLVLWAMRIRMAAARHAIWTGVALAMLLLPAFAMWGPKAPLPVLPRAAVSAPVVILPANDQAAAPLPFPRIPKQPLPNSRTSLWALGIPGLYVAGVFVFVLRLGIGARRAKALVRGTISCAAPVTLGWLHPKVVLPPDWQRWPQARLDAVLAHEREHARRRDPLWQFLALVNRALFWFHPLAWWLERKLSELAEEACDSAVLARGFDAGDYSECLLDLARSIQRSGARIGALSATMPGIGLEHRIRTMLSGEMAQRVSRARMVCAVGLCLSEVAIFSAGTLVRAQDAAKGHPEFEVASIRPANPDSGGGKSKDGGGGGPGIPIAIGHGRFNYSDTLRGLIMQAYHVTACPPRADTCPLISGGPPWINKDFFDIQAKTPEGIPDYTFFQLAQGKAPEIQLMLQALLADRFNLKFHRERKQMPVYALSVAKKGPKLKKSGEVKKAQLPSGLVIEGRGLNFRPVVQPNGDRTIQLSAKNSSMQDVADALAMFIFTRPVINRTGIVGEFDFTVEYAAEGDQPIADLAGPELFTALEEQAGLKLEATRAMVDVLVIDHAEKPSEN